MNRINPLIILVILIIVLIAVIFRTFQLESSLEHNAQALNTFEDKAKAINYLRIQWEGDSMINRLGTIIAPVKAKAKIQNNPQFISVEASNLTKPEADALLKNILNEALHVKNLSLTRQSANHISLSMEIPK